MAQNLDIDNPYCPPNFSGADCSIPYTICPDNQRRCFNNSQCQRINLPKARITGSYEYRCDCSYAEDVSSFAGHECEYSAEVVCAGPSVGKDPKDAKHFCANAGLCGTFIHKAQLHTGCHCPRDFKGAHCQYLKALFDDLDMREHNHNSGSDLNEVLVEDVGDNFYAFKGKPRDGPNVENFSIVLSFVLLSTVGYFSVRYAVNRKSRGRRLKTFDDSSDVNAASDANNVESDGGKNVRLETNESPNAEII